MNPEVIYIAVFVLVISAPILALAALVFGSHLVAFIRHAIVSWDRDGLRIALFSTLGGMLVGAALGFISAIVWLYSRGML